MVCFSGWLVHRFGVVYLLMFVGMRVFSGLMVVWCYDVLGCLMRSFACESCWLCWLCFAVVSLRVDVLVFVLMNCVLQGVLGELVVDWSCLVVDGLSLVVCLFVWAV